MRTAKGGGLSRWRFGAGASVDAAAGDATAVADAAASFAGAGRRWRRLASRGVCRSQRGPAAWFAKGALALGEGSSTCAELGENSFEAGR